MRESLLPHLKSEVNKEALCYGLVCHVTNLSNQVSQQDSKQGLSAQEELLSACNRFPCELTTNISISALQKSIRNWLIIALVNQLGLQVDLLIGFRQTVSMSTLIC